MPITALSLFFFFTATAPTQLYTLSLHDALPIFAKTPVPVVVAGGAGDGRSLTDFAHFAMDAGCRGLAEMRSEEHTSELQSRFDLVCRLLLEKKKKKEE